MPALVSAPATSADPPAPEPVPVRSRIRRWHAATVLLSLALAGWLTGGLWRDPAGQVVAVNVGDQAFFEWLLSYGVYVVTHGADPFRTGLMNVPDGVNLAANTNIAAYTVLFAPLTRLAGPQVSFVTILTLNLAATAWAWFAFLHRWVVRRPAAAMLGGLFAGFAPGLVSHANGHLNWSAGWIAPVVLWRVLALRRGRWARDGAILGLLLAVTFTIAAEGLFFTALACGVFTGVWAAAPAVRARVRAEAAGFVGGLAVAAVTAGALLAYPLWLHFAGPQTFAGTGFNQTAFAEDAGAYLSYPTRSLAGWAQLSGDLAPNPTEEASFFGLPLLLLAAAGTVAAWRRAGPVRRATLRALVVVGLVFTVLSLGPQLRWQGELTGVPLPYAVLGRLPLFDAALPGRLALVVAGVLAVVLAVTAEHVLLRSRTTGGDLRWAAAAAVALVPLVPTPLLHRERAPEPAFVATGAWRAYVPDGGVLSALPLALNVSADGQRWQAYTMARGGPLFRIPAGYFLGPGGPDGRGRIGAPFRATDWLLLRAALYNQVPEVTDATRAQARRDLAYWGVQALVLPDEVTGPEGPLARTALETVATELLGPPERVADVLLWRIRPGVDPVTPAAR